MKPRVMTIVWPSFVMAGVIEGMVFSVVDPADLRLLGHVAVTASPQAIYSVSFLAFWAVISTSGALTAWLCIDPAAIDAPFVEPVPPAD